jgi:hypothetical protein
VRTKTAPKAAQRIERENLARRGSVFFMALRKLHPSAWWFRLNDGLALAMSEDVGSYNSRFLETRTMRGISAGRKRPTSRQDKAALGATDELVKGVGLEGAAAKGTTLQVSTPGSVRIRCGNAERGPYLVRTIPQKYAYGAEIRP